MDITKWCMQYLHIFYVSRPTCIFGSVSHFDRKRTPKYSSKKRRRVHTVCSEIKDENDLHDCRNVNIKHHIKQLNDSKVK